MKKRKRKKLRNKFTDALGEEISSRESLDLQKIEQAKLKPKVDLKKKVKPKPAPVEVAEVKVEPVTEPADVEIKTDTKFEERVFAEAQNNFLDEKPKRPRKMVDAEEDLPSRPIFRAKLMREKIFEEKNADKKTSDKDADLRRKLTHAEVAGAALSAVMLVYSVTTMDKPLFFMSMALFSHTIRPLVGSFFGKHNRAVQNAMHAFSIVLFLGAILFLFI